MSNLKFFNNCTTKQEAKKLFRQLAKQYHPDANQNNDTTETMKEIIAEYEVCMKKLPSDNSNNNSQHENETDEQFKMRVTKEMQEVINNISHLPIDIEIIGAWVWVSGNTYQYKSYLTANNFLWHPKKKMYYWHMEPKKRYKGKTKPIEEIRETYGSTKVKNKIVQAIA
jgi:arsenate reductase-like glutaredoxin family protein